MYQLEEAQISRQKTLPLQIDVWGVRCGILIPIGIWVYQIIHWGMTLEWRPFPVRWIFDALGIGLNAVNSQTEWTLLGWMARTLLDLPLGIVSLVVVIFSASLIARLVDPD